MMLRNRLHDREHRGTKGRQKMKINESEVSLRDCPELWERGDGTDGRSTSILQEIMRLALDLEDGAIAVFCHNNSSACAFAGCLGRAAESRNIYFNFDRSRMKAIVHDTEVSFYGSRWDAIRGRSFSWAFIDNFARERFSREDILEIQRRVERAIV